MEIKHEWQNGPELLHTEWDGKEAKYELSLLEPVLEVPEITGTATDTDGAPKKENRGVFFERVYTPEYAVCSPTSKIIENFIETAKEASFTPNSSFQTIYTMTGFNVLFSAYRNGDYYKSHRDTAKLTVLYWVGEREFEGGDLYLTDFDYTIPYEPNRLIMFPSYYQHEVTPIKTDKEGYVRYCASAFIH